MVNLNTKLFAVGEIGHHISITDIYHFIYPTIYLSKISGCQEHIISNINVIANCNPYNFNRHILIWNWMSFMKRLLLQSRIYTLGWDPPFFKTCWILFRNLKKCETWNMNILILTLAYQSLLSYSNSSSINLAHITD